MEDQLGKKEDFTINKLPHLAKQQAQQHNQVIHIGCEWGRTGNASYSAIEGSLLPTSLYVIRVM